MPVNYAERTRRRLDTRDRVFEAAVAEFRRVGVAQTNIGDVVKAARVARGTFYLHFPTKDDVLLEVFRRRARTLGRVLLSSRARTLRGFLRRAVDLMLDDALNEAPELWPELCGVIVRRAAELREEAVDIVTAFERSFATAQEKGEIRADLPPADLLTVLLPGVYGLLQLGTGLPVREQREALHRVVDVFVRGMAP